jgi:hypothetical protein
VKDKRRSGRPKKLDRRDESQVIRDLTKNPTLPLRVLVNQFNLNKSPNNQISSMTMSRILLKNNLISRKLSIKWKISPNNAKKRLKWAKENLSHDSAYWEKVVFSDESAVQNHSGLKRIRLKRGSDIPPSHFIQKNKWDIKVMVWGYITSSGERGLAFIEESITGEIYRKLLEHKLPNELPGLFDNQMIFQHDGAPAHREYSVQNYLEASGVQVIDWPAQSPDLNLIEACWRFLKSKLKDSYNEEQDLKADIRKIWFEMPTEFIIKLYRSMKDRLREVIRSKGGPTKY